MIPIIAILPVLTILASVVIVVSPSMFWKYNRKYKNVLMTEEDTDEFELPKSGLLTGILLHIKQKCISGIAAVEKQHIEAHISKLEVVGDGDQTLYELSGEQCHAHSFYNDGDVQPMNRNLSGNKTQREMYAIEFGRYLGDLDFMVDLAKWKDLKLKITNTFTTSQFTADQGNVDVILMMAGGAAPAASKYLKTWEFSSDKPSADGQWVNKALPERYDYRRIMFHIPPDLTAGTGQAANDSTGDSYQFKFGFNEMDEVLFDQRPKDMFRLNARQFGLARANTRFTPSTTIYGDMICAYVDSITWGNIGLSLGADATISMMEDSQDRFQKQDFKGGVSYQNAHITGQGYLHTFVVDFDFRKRIEDWIKGADKDPINADWYGYKDDMTFKICPTVPLAQGEA